MAASTLVAGGTGKVSEAAVTVKLTTGGGALLPPPPPQARERVPRTTGSRSQ